MVFIKDWDILIIELTPNQNAFLTRLWKNNTTLLPQKDRLLFTAVNWLHGPITFSVLHWCYYENGPNWLRLAVLSWFWFIVVIASIGLTAPIVKCIAAINSSSLGERKEYDSIFLSYKLMTGINMTYLQLYNFIFSAALVGLFLFTGLYFLALSMCFVKLLGEWYRSLVRRYIQMRLTEVSGNLYVY